MTTNSQYRIEKDSMGPVRVPRKALYGAQTQRAVGSFPVSGWRFGREFIRCPGLIKYASARTNSELGQSSKDVFPSAIPIASMDLLLDPWSMGGI